MKTLTIVLLIVLTAFTGFGQSPANTDKNIKDTTVINIGKREVVISHGGKTNIHFRSSRKNKYEYTKVFKGHWSGFEIGINSFTDEDYSMYSIYDQDFMELDQNKSIAVNLNFIQYDISLSKRKGNFGIVTGLGLSWYNFRFDRDITLIEDENGKIQPEDLDGNWKVKKTKLTCSYITVPVLLEYQVPVSGYRLYCSAGIIGGLKLGSHTKVKYKLNGSHKKKNHDDFNLRPYKLDASIKIGYRGLNLWGTYGLETLFEGDKAPGLTPYALGFGIPF